MCLADFVSQFYVKYKPQKNKKPTSEECLPENDDNDMSEDQESNLLVEELSQSYIFRNGVEIVKRKNRMFLDGFNLIKKLILKNIFVNYLCFLHITQRRYRPPQII